MKRAAIAPLRKARIKKGDQVQVMSGKAKGQTGQVLLVDLKRHTAFIKDVNIQMRHTKPRRQDDKGGILPQEGPVHLSNVLILCDSCNRGVRKLCEKPADCKYNKKKK